MRLGFCWLHVTAPQAFPVSRMLSMFCLFCVVPSCLPHPHPLQVMCIAAIIMMALVAAACILPETVVAVYTKVCQMQDKRRRARAKQARYVADRRLVGLAPGASV